MPCTNPVKYFRCLSYEIIMRHWFVSGHAQWHHVAFGNYWTSLFVLGIWKFQDSLSCFPVNIRTCYVTSLFTIYAHFDIFNHGRRKILYYCPFTCKRMTPTFYWTKFPFVPGHVRLIVHNYCVFSNTFSFIEYILGHHSCFYFPCKFWNKLKWTYSYYTLRRDCSIHCLSSSHIDDVYISFY